MHELQEKLYNILIEVPFNLLEFFLRAQWNCDRKDIWNGIGSVITGYKTENKND